MRLIDEAVILSAHINDSAGAHRVGHVTGDRFGIAVAATVRDEIRRSGRIGTRHWRLEHAETSGDPQLVVDMIVGSVREVFVRKTDRKRRAVVVHMVRPDARRVGLPKLLRITHRHRIQPVSGNDVARERCARNGLAVG